MVKAVKDMVKVTKVMMKVEAIKDMEKTVKAIMAMVMVSIKAIETIKDN